MVEQVVKDIMVDVEKEDNLIVVAAEVVLVL